MTTYPIRRDDADQRLDRFLRKLLPSATLGNLFKLVRRGRVRVNGAKAKPDQRLVEGDEVEIRLAQGQIDELRQGRGARRAAPRSRSAAAIREIHRDAHVLAVDKPPFLVVQRGGSPDEPTLEELVVDPMDPPDALTFRPALAHRIDRGTSGVVLFGLSAAGLRGLTRMFRERLVDKRYLALVEGDMPAEDRFDVDLPLARDPSDDKRGAKVKVSRGAGSQEAHTTFRILVRGDGCGLIEAQPHTGRTHQIRAHLRAAGLPIVGDPTYGRPRRTKIHRERAGLWRQFLHAWRLSLDHPVPVEDVDQPRRLELESPLPADLRRALEWAGLSWPGDGK